MHIFKGTIGSARSVKLALILAVILDLKQTLGYSKNEQKIRNRRHLLIIKFKGTSPNKDIFRIICKFEQYHNEIRNYTKQSTDIGTKLHTEIAKDKYDILKESQNQTRDLFETTADSVLEKLFNASVKRMHYILISGKNKYYFLTRRKNSRNENVFANNHLSNLHEGFSAQRDTTDGEITSFQPSADRLVVMGHVIKASQVNEIVQGLSEPKPKTVEVFSLNKFVVDASLIYTGVLLQLLIIAPTWEIIGTQDIILDGIVGADAAPKKAPGGVDPGSKGQPGKSGEPGEPGGHVLAIGGRFINGEGLRVFAKGGRGGCGQDGGDGARGLDGKFPLVKINSDEKEWKEKGFVVNKVPHKKRHFFCKFIFCKINAYTVGEYFIYGTNGTSGGDGGDGGGGGSGGAGGVISVIELNGESISSNNIDCKEGVNGSNGVGGEGGLGGENGGLIVAKFKRNKRTRFHGMRRIPYGGRAANGTHGTSGQANKYEQKRLSFANPSLTINYYKNYLRDNLKNNSNGTLLIDFYNEMDRNEKVNSLYDTVGFVDDLKGLEVQYYKIHDDVSIVPFYKSLLNRISKYAKDLKSYEKREEEKDQYKKVLCYLYTAAMSKVTSIESGTESNLVIDMKGYLQLIANNINNLKESTLEAARDEFSNHYRVAIDDKIQEANSVINSEIKPEIDNIFDEINEEVKLLTNEIIDLQKRTKNEIKKIEKKKKSLRKNIYIRQMFSSVSFIATFVGLTATMADSVSKLINDGVIITDSIISHYKPVTYNQIPIAINNGLLLMKDILEREYDLKLYQLKDVENDLLPFHDFDMIRKNISHLRDKIINEMPKLVNGNKTLYDKWETDLKYELGNQSATLMEQIIKGDVLARQKMEIIDHAINLISIPADLYISIRNDKEQIQAVSEEIKESVMKLNYLRQHENAIHNIIVPSFNQLKSFIETTEKHLKDGTNFKYEVENWQMHHKIDNIKSIVHALTSGFKVDDRVMHFVAKLQDGMTTVINMYDLINKYRDQAELYTFIEYIGSKDVTTIAMRNAELKSAILKLDQMIKTNIVLSQYRRATSTFMQYVFPLASSYISQLSLTLRDESTDNLMFNAIIKLEKLKEEISESAATSTKYDKYIHTDVRCSRDDDGSPFYVWDFDTHSESIWELLQGKEVSLEADVTKSFDNAVKFNLIMIKLRASNDTVQSRLDEVLNDFSVTLVHSGNSYYRCGDKFYTISSDRQTMEYSFRRDANGEPADTNLVYRKIRDNDYILSPYTVWSIRIFGGAGNTVNLSEFREERIDLELEGRGQYAERGGFDDEVCQQGLDSYYRVDGALAKRGLIQAMEEIDSNPSTIMNEDSITGLPPEEHSASVAASMLDTRAS